MKLLSGIQGFISRISEKARLNASHGKMLLKLEELYHSITLALSSVLTGHIFIARSKQDLQYDYSSRVIKKKRLLCRGRWYDHDFLFFFS